MLQASESLTQTLPHRLEQKVLGTSVCTLCFGGRQALRGHSFRPKDGWYGDLQAKGSGLIFRVEGFGFWVYSIVGLQDSGFSYLGFA